MIDIKILSRYLPYGLKFKNLDTNDVFVLNSIHMDGSIILNDTKYTKNTVNVNSEYVGTLYKPILDYIKEAGRTWYGYGEESFMEFLDMYGLIDENKAVKAQPLQYLR